MIIKKKYQSDSPAAAPRMPVILLASAMAVMIAIPNMAQSQDQDDGSKDADVRYQIVPDNSTENGFIRLNKKTGETSFCRKINNDLVCKLAIDERKTFLDEINKLQDQLSGLQEQLGTPEKEESTQLRPKSDVPEPSAPDDDAGDPDAFERELDKALDVTKQTMRKLFKAVKEFQKELSENPIE